MIAFQSYTDINAIRYSESYGNELGGAKRR